MTEEALSALGSVVLLLAVASAVGLVGSRVPIPHSVLLVAAGIVWQLVTPPIPVDPALVLVALLPGLVFEAALRTELEDLRSSLLGVALLAVPGVVLGALVVAGALTLAGLPFELAFVAGAIVAATDPVAVISTFKRLRSPRPLAGFVEAESLFNDGTAIVLYAIALRAVGGATDPGAAVADFAVVIGASAAIGVALGLVGWRLAALVDDGPLEVLITLLVGYGSFLVGEALQASGIVTTVVAGMTLAAMVHRPGHRPTLARLVEPTWEAIGYVLSAAAFILVGLAIGLSDLADSLLPIAAGIVGVLLARALVVYGLLGAVVRVAHPAGLSRGVPLAWRHVLFWAGLRGAVAVGLALSLPIDLPRRELVQEVVFGIVLFTLVVQGWSAGWLVGRLGLREDRAPASGTS